MWQEDEAVTRAKPSDGSRIGIVDNGMRSIISMEQFQHKLDVDGWVRLSTDDFSRVRAMPTGQTKLVHFNLGRTTNEIGLRYAIVPIVEPGWRKEDGTEVPPYVGLDQAIRSLCIGVDQRVALAAVTDDHYRHSMPGIDTPDALRLALLSRYRRMNPELSDEQILAEGCAITTLDLSVGARA